MAAASDRKEREPVAYTATEELRPANAESTCLRPLGLCELGGCCDVCWYRPDHPRFSRQRLEAGTANGS
jgi:hypothetical protein